MANIGPKEAAARAAREAAAAKTAPKGKATPKAPTATKADKASNVKAAAKTPGGLTKGKTATKAPLPTKAPAKGKTMPRQKSGKALADAVRTGGPVTIDEIADSQVAAGKDPTAPTPEAIAAGTSEAAAPRQFISAGGLSNAPAAKTAKGKKATAPRVSTPAMKADAATKDASLPTPPRANTKQSQVIELLRRPAADGRTHAGATPEEIIKATDWARHTVRGFLSTLSSKQGHAVQTVKVDKQRWYWIDPAPTA